VPLVCTLSESVRFIGWTPAPICAHATDATLATPGVAPMLCQESTRSSPDRVRQILSVGGSRMKERRPRDSLGTHDTCHALYAGVGEVLRSVHAEPRSAS
jgi:hypothetical protein